MEQMLMELLAMDAVPFYSCLAFALVFSTAVPATIIRFYKA